MTERTPEEIAAGLTERQRRALTWDFEQNHPSWGARISCWGDGELARSLFALRLIQAPNTFELLTPLGRRVSTLIEKDSRRGG